MILRLRTQLYVIWLIRCSLRAAQVVLASTGCATLSSVHTVLQRVLIERTMGRELCARILPKLDVQLRTPTPAALPEALWRARTPTNLRELEAQSTLIRDRVRRHKGSSPASIIEGIGQLKKGAEVMMLSAELMRDRITSLERANEATTKRRQRKKKRIQRQGTSTKGEEEDILAQYEANQQIQREQRQDGERSCLSRQALARCKRCSETGHNSRTYKKDTLETA